MTDTMDAVAVEEVAMVEEDVVTISISPTTPGMLLTSGIFIRISAVTISMPLRGTVDNMLDINAAVERLVTDTVTV